MEEGGCWWMEEGGCWWIEEGGCWCMEDGGCWFSKDVCWGGRVLLLAGMTGGQLEYLSVEEPV